MAQASAQALQTSLSKLQLSQNSKATPKIKKAAPADSWEDEADRSTSSTDTETESNPFASPAPPPPTPSSPSQTSLHASNTPPDRTSRPDSYPSSSGDSSPTRRPRDGDGEERRPEKSTAVASRLIAAGIGQKAPKRTKEQREYDAAVKAQERKKGEVVKAEEERKRVEREKARKDVWGD